MIQKRKFENSKTRRRFVQLYNVRYRRSLYLAKRNKQHWWFYFKNNCKKCLNYSRGIPKSFVFIRTQSWINFFRKYWLQIGSLNIVYEWMHQVKISVMLSCAKILFQIASWECSCSSVTRLGDLLDFGQLLKAFGNN